MGDILSALVCCASRSDLHHNPGRWPALDQPHVDPHRRRRKPLPAALGVEASPGPQDPHARDIEVRRDQDGSGPIRSPQVRSGLRGAQPDAVIIRPSPAAPPHPRLRQRIPVHFRRHPRPVRAFVGGLAHFRRHPRPARAFSRGPGAVPGICLPAPATGAMRPYAVSSAQCCRVKRDAQPLAPGTPSSP